MKLTALLKEQILTLMRSNFAFRAKILQNCKNTNHNSIQSQPNITLVRLDVKMTLHTTPPHPHNSMSAISQLLLTQF